MDKERIIQEFVPGNRSHWRISSRIPARNWRRKWRSGCGRNRHYDANSRRNGDIAGDLALKAADVHIGFLDRLVARW